LLLSLQLQLTWQLANLCIGCGWPLVDCKLFSFKHQGYIPVEELEAIRERHDVEVKNIQDEYEAKLQELLMEVGRLQASQQVCRNCF